MEKLLAYIKGRFMGYYINTGNIKEKLQILLSAHGNILDTCGAAQGTDKASICVGNTVVRLGHDYLRHYDFFFSSFRNNKFSLLEFGCYKGDSLRMWEQYFPEAQIYGVDLDEGARRHEKGRIHIVTGDAASQDTYDRIKAETDSAFIILDDASHAWSDQRRSFELFWDMVAPGGFYVIEDLVCGTKGAYSPPKVLDAQPFFDYMRDRCEFLRWCVDWQPEERSYHFADLPEHIQKIEREMDMCVFIPGAVIVRKKA